MKQKGKTPSVKAKKTEKDKSLNQKSESDKRVRKAPNKHLQKLGARIRQIRKEMGYSNADHFSYDHSISRSQFSRWETGVDDVKFTSLMRLIEIFKMTPQEFFSEGFDD